MAFSPEKITKKHILDAVKKIEKERIELEPSTKFDVIINGNRYPPKEVLRFAHELMNGERIWNRGGGEPTNKYFTKFGFEIKSKADKSSLTGIIWKLGCNWGRGAPSFYEFIKKKSIVIGEDSKRYKIGDLILVCEGHKVNALARVNETPIPVTTNLDFKKPFEELSIDYEERINYADAEWYLLKDNEEIYYQLQQGIVRVNQDHEVYQKALQIWNSRKNNTTSILTNQVSMQAKNIILYGPPGTGKTYNSIEKAVELITEQPSLRHEESKKRFDEFRKLGQIEFVTFHQNYSYEDFMVGIRPNVDEETDSLSFRKHYGVFYKIAERARDNYKSSLEPKGKLLSVHELVSDLLDKLRNGEIIKLNTPTNVPFEIEYLSEHTIQLVYNNGSKKNTLSIDTIIDLTEGKREFPSSLRSYYYPLKDYLLAKRVDEKKDTEALKNYVLVIDEINRANISKVFGELITLLEDDKRLGAPNEIKITLPNGEKEFGVPPNLYVIGTMNTADKSIALIDIALRRRFEFIGFYPQYKNYDSNAIQLLKKVNSAIFKEKNSADYLIGHAYFMNMQSIETVLRTKVVPLLMEYFSGKTDTVTRIFADTSWSVSYDTTNFNWDISQR